jgi:hypothetical protein
MVDFQVPLIIRGTIIEDCEVEVIDRMGAGRSFSTPSTAKYIDRIISHSPENLADLYTITFDDIVDYLNELADRLCLDTNAYWREAFEVSCRSSNVSRSVLEAIYRTSPNTFRPAPVREVAEARIGIRHLEGWSETKLDGGRTIAVRAIGSRSVHVIAGNVPLPALTTLLRSAITRNDAIVKVPWNDPLTMVALARTMIEMAPDHPLTKHLTVCYWKSGDDAVEERLYQPGNIEKIVAWGGNASLKHISKHLKQGIDLIALDPKSSTTLIGKEALIDDDTMLEIARRTAADLGGWDQEACVNARVMFLESGTDESGIAKANLFGQYVFDALQTLPTSISAGPTNFDPRLKEELQSVMQQRDFYKLITDKRNIEKTGAVIVSQFAEQVDFPGLLYGRVGNIVPVDDINEAFGFFSSATQTVGVYPDELRRRIRDRASLMGGQWFVPVGYAISGSSVAPQDGIEPERRMCRWVVDFTYDPAGMPAPWMHAEEAPP